ncbi:hypothetical protein LOTGIDRAFT_235088 [Lottia gigantea]|uniref:SEA domain-containing protein n=1 Tax=Lottia gigantea TaxID=225164 RepID=V3ZSU1_LOTGI|nr:hypothetical protein LOTGIDRAFT_235088 [Lottia gigantea]ESO87412.1 hypothetical protein LOTGIDRAFT_235088 [Lottia gigantea]
MKQTRKALNYLFLLSISGSILEESQIQTLVSLTTIPSYYTSTTLTAFQIAPTSYLVLPESYVPQVTSGALPQSSEQSSFRPSNTIRNIASLNINLNNRGSQSFSVDSDSVISTSESRAFPEESSAKLSGILAMQSFASSGTVRTSQVLDLMPSVINMISSNIVPTSSVKDVMSSNIEPTSSLKDLMLSNIEPTSSLKDLMLSNIEPTSSLKDVMLSKIEPTSSLKDVMSNTVSPSSVIGEMSSNIAPTSSLKDVMLSNIAPTLSVIDEMSSNIAPTSSLKDMMLSNIVPTLSVVDEMSNIVPTSPVINVVSSMVDLMSSDKVPTSSLVDPISSDIVIKQTDLVSTQFLVGSTLNDIRFSPSTSQFSSTASKSESVFNEKSLFETITDLSVINLSSELATSTDTSSAYVSGFNSALFSSDTETVVPTDDVSYVDSSLLDTYSYISSELLESQTQSDMTAFSTSVSSEILFPISSYIPEEIASSLATHILSLSSLTTESSAYIDIPETTSLVISPSSILAVSSVTSSTLVNETLPVPEKNTSGLTKGGKVALGICIPIIIILVIAAIVFVAYRRRYHTATWKLTDVVSYRPWSYSNATYYDDESTLIVSSLDK